MATKYNRETVASEGIESRRTPWMRQGPPQRPLSRRQRVFIVIAGLIAIGLLVQIAQRLNRDAPYRFQPSVQGIATVVGLNARGESGAGEIVLEIDVEGGGAMTGRWPVSPPYWEKFVVGDRVAVRYYLSERRTSLKLIECALVALPG